VAPPRRPGVLFFLFVEEAGVYEFAHNNNGA
jgi:hypothetical protein